MRLTREQHSRVKMPPQYCSTLIRSTFAEWGLIKANARRGVFRVKIVAAVRVFRAAMSHARSRERGMKEATKRAASEVLAQMLAVTALLVIAGVVFYVR